MGNLYRFVEPVVLFLLKTKGQSYGYDLASELKKHALTDAEIEVAALVPNAPAVGRERKCHLRMERGWEWSGAASL